MRLEQLIEAKKKQEKIVFKESDPQNPFPKDTMTAIKKRINVFAKDLTKDWDNAIDLLDSVLAELNVPKPQAFLRERWKQYQELLEFTINNMYESRGLEGDWNSLVT